MKFEDSYVGRLRAKVGNDMLKLPGACVVILNRIDGQEHVLLERGPGRARWRLIGGIAEARESLLQCALREVHEETGLTLFDLRPFGFCDDPGRIFTLANGHVVHAHTMLFVTDRFEGKPMPDGVELEECRWFTRHRLPDTLHPTARLHLEAYARFEASGQFQLL